MSDDGFRDPLTSTIINTILSIFTVFRCINTRDLITLYVFQVEVNMNCGNRKILHNNDIDNQRLPNSDVTYQTLAYSHPGWGREKLLTDAPRILACKV